ncbi:MAG: Methylated-DNA--protein-cysteine methyltransferase [Ignavibacteriae bacterium]|nr:MAG: Methylated-DNA--protein-cysteine methyltransferase [Ignavibacteriota bacterium]
MSTEKILFEIERPSITLIRKKSDYVVMRQRTQEQSSYDGKVYCTSFDSRIGHIYIASTDNGVCRISIPKETRRDFFSWLHSHFELDSVVENKSRNKEYIDQINRYLNGKLVEFTFPIDLIGTPFQIRVWRELMKIPYGTTITYRQLAKRVGVPKGFQAVGRANGANPIPIVIPCHRVIGSDGSLIGYAAGVKTKEFLLRLEGAIII